MIVEKILNIENDGLNIVVDGQIIYIRCKRSMYKYNLTDMSLVTHNGIFKKDGKARGFAIYDNFIFLTDFCDLYILSKDGLQILEVLKLGTDLSSDIWGVWFSNRKAYIAIRNGKMAIVDIDTRIVEKFEISDSSFWGYSVIGNRIYAGTVKGELIEVNRDNMQVIRKIELCRKNIYSTAYNDGLIYTISQDQTIKIIDAISFEIICVARKAVKGMARIIGICKENLIIADSGQIAIWDKESLQIREKFSFPLYGATLVGNKIYGSDNKSVYCSVLT